MRVIATAVGYDNIAVREVDTEFDFDADPKDFGKLPDGRTSYKGKYCWFKPVAEPKKSKDADLV